MSEQSNELLLESPNVIWIGETGFEAYGQNLVALVDEYRSGYECLRCKGEDIRTFGGEGTVYDKREISVVQCDECAGKGRRPKAGNPNIEVACTACEERGVIPCPDCNGTGGTLAMPDESKGQPQTGKLVSVGADADKDMYKLGHRIMFASFAGFEFTVKGKKIVAGKTIEKKYALRFLKGSDILSRVYGTLEFKNAVRGKALYTAS